jgi:hypothetical protein
MPRWLKKGIVKVTGEIQMDERKGGQILTTHCSALQLSMESDYMIVPDPKVLLNLTPAKAREVFAGISDLIARTRSNKIFLDFQEIQKTHHCCRQRLWLIFTKLEQQGFIRRLPGSKSWKNVQVNPDIIRPTSLRGERLETERKEFLGDGTEKEDTSCVVTSTPALPD